MLRYTQYMLYRECKTLCNNAAVTPMHALEKLLTTSIFLSSPPSHQHTSQNSPYVQESVDTLYYRVINWLRKSKSGALPPMHLIYANTVLFDLDLIWETEDGKLSTILYHPYRFKKNDGVRDIHAMLNSILRPLFSKPVQVHWVVASAAPVKRGKPIGDPDIIISPAFLLEEQQRTVDVKLVNNGKLDVQFCAHPAILCPNLCKK